MRKILKRDLRLFIVLALCFFLSIFLVHGFRYLDEDIEENFYTEYLEKEEMLPLKNDIYVITIPSISDNGLSDEAKEEMENKQIEKIKGLVTNTLPSARGVFVLGTDLLSDVTAERKCMPAFREAGNVFWHYSTRNTGYYYKEDNCGQIKFVDRYYGSENHFEILGEARYSRNFLPYFYMTMDGGSIKYDEENQTYLYREKSGETHTLHASEDGTIRTRQASEFGITYLSLDAFYDIAKKYKNTDKYENAIVFFQDRNSLSKYANEVSDTQDLASYYIDVLATIQNAATTPTLLFQEKLCLILAGILLLGLVIVFLSELICILVYVAETGILFLVNFWLIGKNICYLPVIEFTIALTGTLLIMLLVKHWLRRIVARNLPIDAVIRFTKTIMDIEHSVSYSEYLMKNRNEIEEDISASLLLPVMDKESFLLKELSAENHRGRRFVENEFWQEKGGTSSSVIQTRSNLFQGINYVAFVPLPVFDVESEVVTYTVIGLKKKLKPQKASYISMMLFSMYIYFKAQHERGEHQRMYFSMLSLMISVIDAKDPVTAGHSQRVARDRKSVV